MISQPKMANQSKTVTCIITLPKTVEVPGRTVQLIPGRLLASTDPNVQEGLVEALDSSGVPKLWIPVECQNTFSLPEP